MDEVGLIQSAQKGDIEAFNRLVLKYQNMVYNQAYRVMGDASSASDATQDAFISAFRKMHTFRGGSFKAWLLRIVTNTCYDEIRRRKRRPSTPLNPTDEDSKEIESPYWIKDPGEMPEDFTARMELSEAIQRCLDNLPIDFRTTVILVDVQGMDYAEAASVMGTPTGTIKSRLARSRKSLRDCLEGYRELLPAAFRLEIENT